jgi:hypothetical protein
MGREVWIRASLVFGTLLCVFITLGVWTYSGSREPLGQGINASFSFLSLQQSGSANCVDQSQNPYSPLGSGQKKNSPSQSGNHGTRQGSSSSSDQPNTPPSSQQPSNNNIGSSPPAAINQSIFDFLSWLAIIALAIILIFLLYMLFKNVLGRPMYREGSASGAGGSSGMGIQGFASPRDAFQMAEDLAAQGKYREALRLLYQGVLSQLAVLGVIDWEKRRTNWELLRLLQQHGQVEIHKNLMPMTQVFERAWYGETPITLAEYQMARQVTQSILGGVKAS